MYKVIIVEDEDIIRRGIIYSIPWEKMNCNVVGSGGNGQEGISLIREKKPDILIADINMPIIDGLEMLRQTYEEYSYASIILSGYSNFEYAQEAIKYGVFRYILKPFNQKEMVEVVSQAIQEREKINSYNNHLNTALGLTNDFMNENIQYKGTDDVVNKMLQFVSEHFSEKFGMKDIVLLLHYSDTFLNKRFKDLMGTTFMEYVNRYRIRKSIEYIRSGKMDFQTVAGESGIGDYKYFKIVFMKYVGCSPRQYESELKNCKK